MAELHLGDCLDVLRTMPDASVDSVVTDPPYGLSFMGKAWDYDVPTVEVWREVFRVLKPGGHLLAFAGTRTQHRMAVNIEDAGFEIRDMIAWVYGSGFPKSLDVSKAIDKMDAADEQMQRRYRFTEWVRSTGLTSKQIDEATGTNMGGHYTTAASQPAIMTMEHLDAVRHLIGEVPEWVERECEIRSVESENFKAREVVGVRENAMSGWDVDGGTQYKDRAITAPATPEAQQWAGWGTALKPSLEPITVARRPLAGTVAENVLRYGTGAVNVDACRVSGKRWPANLIHDGSDEVVGLFPQTGPSQQRTGKRTGKRTGCLGAFSGQNEVTMGHNDAGGSAARFFYTAKANKAERKGSKHPTVKPLDLMRYLCRLVTPPGGVVLDPFMGSGTTIEAALAEGFQAVGIERDLESFEDTQRRIDGAQLGLPL